MKLFSMRPLFVLLVGVLFGLGIVACGRAGHRVDAGPYHAVKNDNDGDGDSGNDDVNWGQPADRTDLRVVTAVIKRYYDAAAAGDGATACSLTYKTVAEEIAQPQTRQPDGRTLPSLTCAAVMSKDLKQLHRQLVAELATLKLVGVRDGGNIGLVFLNFGVGPEREITIHREHRTWKIEGLLDTSMG